MPTTAAPRARTSRSSSIRARHAGARARWGLGFTPGWEARGEKRGSFYIYDDAPAERGLSGAGTVHHVAWACEADDQEAWRERVIAAGGQPTPIIDRFYFKSIYFR